MLQFSVKLFRQLDGKSLGHLSELSYLSLVCRLIFLCHAGFDFIGNALWLEMF